MSFGVEEHFVLRLPEKQGKELASAIDSSRLRKRLKINMNGTERSGECRVHLVGYVHLQAILTIGR